MPHASGALHACDNATYSQLRVCLRRTSPPLTVVARYYRELLAFLSRKIPDRSEAADLVQESYARLFAAEKAGTIARDPRALLYKTARNLVIDQGRRGDVRNRYSAPDDELAQEPDEVVGPDAFEPDVALQSQQLVQAMLATIDSLPPRCRQAFVLHKFDGLSHAEVAAQMGVTIKMVEHHVKMAMRACIQCRDQANGTSNAPAPELKRRKREQK